MELAEHLELLEETALEESGKRSTLTPEEIKELTDLVVKSNKTQADAVTFWNRNHEDPHKKISKSAVSKYVSWYVTNKEYFASHKRGPKGLLSDVEIKELLQITAVMRRVGWQLSAPRFRSIARGICKKHRGDGAFEPVHGVAVFSESWARNFMIQNGFRVRSATTTRVVDIKEVIDVGNEWFSNLRVLRDSEGFVVYADLCYNVDEFFSQLDENKHTWTWERVSKGEQKHIAVKKDKLGFTCSVMSSMVGEFVLLQMIWEGKTTESEARTFDAPHPKIFQQHREDSHFQNATTWAAYLQKLKELTLPLRKKIAQEYRLEELPPIMLFIDAASQHECPQCDWCIFIKIPAKMTHIFQPADQYVIVCLKMAANKAYYRWIEDTVKQYDVHTAAAILNGAKPPVDANGGKPNWTKAAYRRSVKYKCLAGAIDALSVASIVKSWARTGITLALTGEQPMETLKDGSERHVPIVFQEYERIFAEEEDLDALAVLGEDDEAPPVPHVAPPPPAHVKVPPLAPTAAAIAALAPPPPGAKKSKGRPVGTDKKQEKLAQAAKGCMDIRRFMVKRDREDDPQQDPEGGTA